MVHSVVPHVLTQRLHRAESDQRLAVPATASVQTALAVAARRAHMMVVAPTGRADRHRAHALVCDPRTIDEFAQARGVADAESSAVTAADLMHPLSGAARANSPRSSETVGAAVSLTTRRPSRAGRGPRSAGLMGLSARRGAPALAAA